MPRLPSGSPEAAAVIWNWQPPESTTDPEGASRVRSRAALQAALGATVGALIFLFWSHTLGWVVFGVTGFVFVAALTSPRGLYAAIERLFAALGGVVGRVVNWLALATLFYLFFLPFGLLFRRGRSDQMRRFYEEDAASYWEARERGRSASTSRLRQF